MVMKSAEQPMNQTAQTTAASTKNNVGTIRPQHHEMLNLRSGTRRARKRCGLQISLSLLSAMDDRVSHSMTMNATCMKLPLNSPKAIILSPAASKEPTSLRIPW